VLVLGCLQVCEHLASKLSKEAPANQVVLQGQQRLKR
jgi:hypothetical protein